MRDRNGRPLGDDIGLLGSALWDKVRDLLQQGNLRRLLILRPGGSVLADIPLTAAAAVLVLLIWLVPTLVAVAAIAALIARFRVEIERDRQVHVVDGRDPED